MTAAMPDIVIVGEDRVVLVELIIPYNLTDSIANAVVRKANPLQVIRKPKHSSNH